VHSNGDVESLVKFHSLSARPPKLPENAPTPTTMAPTYVVGDWVHVGDPALRAVLGAVLLLRIHPHLTSFTKYTPIEVSSMIEKPYLI